MREVLFRAWSEKRKCYEHNVSINDGHAIRNGYQWFSESNDVYASQLEQFTGLYDSTKWGDLTKMERKQWVLDGNLPSEWKGRLIFEGDILRDNKGEDGIVAYIESVACFMAVRDGKEAWDLNEGDPKRSTQLQYTKVVGNIHGNSLEAK